jgi:eukaryotic-like serine/threonine-protein kinase
MNSERYQKVCDIFAEADELPHDKRAAFLDEKCAGDDDLRSEVESLLASDAESGTFIESPALEVAAEMMAHQEAATKVGQQIGHYKIISLLGAGGMGEVWLAEDTRLKRQIALKLLSAVHRKELLARFEQEAYAASALNHPNIITIFDIGQSDGWQFIATEYINGKTLRQLIKEKTLNVSQSIDIAVEICAALAAAHSAGIIHRDIKPENIMIRADGIVKVLDFGLARFSPKSPSTPDAKFITKPGMVMGTVTYMSPEQARGLPVDEKTDVFSLGIVLYEMLTGKQPFQGETEMDVLAAILEREPQYLSDRFPESLRNIIKSSLRKNHLERASTANVLNELRAIKREFDFSAESVNQNTFINSYAEKTAELNALTGDNVERGTNNIVVAPSNSGWGLGGKIAVMLVLLAATFSGFAFYRYWNGKNAPAVLSETDKLLLADFENKTGDEDFDGTLRQPLAVSLAQSPYISLVPDGQIRQTLKQMEKPATEPLTYDIAKEVSQRREVKAFLKGTIENYGVEYLITLEAFNSQTGESVAREQIESKNKDTVLDSLDDVSAEMREKLGESLASIKKFDTPLKTSMTASMDALKFYTFATKSISEGRIDEAITFYKQAIEIDPNYAGAYASLATTYGSKGQMTAAKEMTEKAFSLRNRMTERERQKVTGLYYVFVTGELDKDIENLEAAKVAFPREDVIPLNLGASYNDLGKFSKAEENARIALKMSPNLFFAYSNLARYLAKQSRFAESKAVYEDAIKHNLDNEQISQGLFTVAFVNGDEAEMQRQLAILKSKREETALLLQGNPLIFAGRAREYEKVINQAVAKATAKEMPDVAADYTVQAAVNFAALGKCKDAQILTDTALKLDREQQTLTDATLATALCGGQSEPLIAELKERFPKFIVVNSLWLPIIRAATEMKDSPERALETLEINRQFEGATSFWDNYLRGKIYLKINKPDLAAAEFQKIIENRGWAVQSPLYALAHLEIAKAYEQQKDAEKAKKFRDEFNQMWKNADADLPVLKEIASR